MTEQSEGKSESAAEVSGYSFPYGVPLVLYPLFLYGAYQGAGHWWGWVCHGVFLVSVIGFMVTALRRVSWQKIQAQYPDLNRLTWVLNYLLFFSLLPALVWFFLFGAKWLQVCF